MITTTPRKLLLGNHVQKHGSEKSLWHSGSEPIFQGAITHLFFLYKTGKSNEKSLIFFQCGESTSRPFARYFGKKLQKIAKLLANKSGARPGTFGSGARSALRSREFDNRVPTRWPAFRVPGSMHSALCGTQWK